MNTHLQGHFLAPLVNFYQCRRPIDWSKQFLREAPLNVEIGFGWGETFLRSAIHHPERNFVGVEQHWQSIYKALRLIQNKKREAEQKDILQNIKILKADAIVAFERLFALSSIDQIDCYFPCPWPKKKHTKYRLFSKTFLKLFNSRLKNKGYMKIVTDFFPFMEWILKEAGGTGFVVQTKTIHARFDTKYERKWQRQGQEHFYEITLIKEKHFFATLKEDIVIKSYRLKAFDPQRFIFENSAGNPSIIFKDILYDRLKETALIHLIVAEENLTQHLRVSINKEKNTWLVKKAEGQEFFPTEGIAKAIEYVYETAQKTVQPIESLAC